MFVCVVLLSSDYIKLKRNVHLNINLNVHLNRYMGFLSNIFKKDDSKKSAAKQEKGDQKVHKREFNPEGLVEVENEVPSPFLTETPRTINER